MRSRLSNLSCEIKTRKSFPGAQHANNYRQCYWFNFVAPQAKRTLVRKRRSAHQHLQLLKGRRPCCEATLN